jgi:phosphomannomutase
MLGILLLAKQQGKKVSGLAADLPTRFTASDRLKNFATEKSREILSRLDTGDDATDKKSIETVFGHLAGPVAALNRTDGVRITFTNDEIIHLRPSGNAPEFRCYTEAATNDRAVTLNSLALEKLISL